MNLAEAFANSAQKYLSKPAIFYGEQQITYVSLLDQTNAFAAHLTTELGARPGDRVALWLKNCPEFVPALFGILAAGAVVVPINNFLKPNEVAYILEDAGIDLLVTDRTMSEQIGVLQASRPATKAWYVEDFSTLPPRSKPIITVPDQT